MSPRSRALRSLLFFTFSTVACAGGCTPRSSTERTDEKPKTQTAPAQTGHPDPHPAPSSSAAEVSEKEKPSAKEARELSEAFPPEDKVRAVTNPKKREPYGGPVGSVIGVIQASGDPVPPTPHELQKMEANCTDSRTMFGTLFREGKNRELADVLVAVTEYEGFVPAKEKYVVVKAKGCAWDRRTIAMTYGQSLEIQGIDNRPYVPELLGQPMPAQLFVLPTAPSVRIPPQKPGRYMLVDSMRLFNKAEVFVVPYATVDVTGLDGKFEIKGIPAGKVKVSALLPQTMAVTEKEVTIQAGQTTVVDLTIPFSRAQYDKMEKPPLLEERPSP